ncbi:HEAT repeat domain-containing protein [Lysobacter soli]|uniref:HEAT repeat domain-containing protein n=1 Tax=Lysobacter soli TaxID=453783 RepID=A0A3D8VG15_9GAMM|nr:HEAT repeat domain-containing protein [Lysobacter soli]RDY67768.1 HEAT repeat domain-containing protein [Lysobacter soli]
MEWTSWLPVDPLLRLASLIASLLAVVTVLVLLQVLVLSTLATRQRRAREAFDRQWRPHMAMASLDNDIVCDLPAPRGRRRLWWLMLWNKLQRKLRGEATSRLNRLLLSLGLDEYALRLLRFPGVRNRLVALETLRHLGDAAHWDAVEPLAHGRNPFVAFAAAQALIAMDAPRATRTVLPIALEGEHWGGQRLVALCRQAGRDAVTDALLDLLARADARALARLAPLLAFADPVRAAPWARERALGDADARNRQASLKALGELGDPRDKPLIVRSLHDEDPAVRLTAAQALRASADLSDIEVLLPALADQSWWVRREVADTLAALPRMDDGALQSLLPRVEDRYGREALERARAERAMRAGRA